MYYRFLGICFGLLLATILYAYTQRDIWAQITQKDFETTSISHTIVRKTTLSVSTVTHTPTLTPRPLFGIPARFVYPRLQVNAPIELVGKDADGAMSTPATIDAVALYAYGYGFNDYKHVVINGHYDGPGGIPAVFYNLSQGVVGDTLIVSDHQGKHITYQVVAIDTYTNTQVPLAEIFTGTGEDMLYIITCFGSWDYINNTYQSRLVVRAQRIAESW